MKILQVNFSPPSKVSHSIRLATTLVGYLFMRNNNASLTVRDFSYALHPALDDAACPAIPEGQCTAPRIAEVAADDTLFAEVRAADAIVLAAPMYNFGVSVQLKHWIDAITRAHVTFQCAENGTERLLKNKTAYAILTRGGIYCNTPTDTQVPYLKTMLGCLGMTNIHFIYAEGLAMGAEAEQNGLAAAWAQIEQAVAK